MNSLAFSLALEEANAEHWLEMIKAGGFDGVEPTFVPQGTLPNVADPRGSAQKLRTLADKAGLKIPSMRGGPGFWPTMGAVDQSLRDKAVELARAALEAVKIMGGDTLLIVPGRWDGDQTYGEIWQHAADTAKRIAQIAEELDMNVGLENVENFFLLSPRDWMSFLDEVGSKRVRMYFDAGNIVYRGMGYPDQWLLELGLDYITRVHFKDATSTGELKYLLEGDVNWPAVNGALQQINYNDWIGIELIPPKHHPAAMIKASCCCAKAILEKS
jgi:hexulose-6-phosphate isomerase